MYQLTARRAAMMPKDSLIMHPGPVNRGVEKIETEKHVALLCVVGEGLGTTKGIAAKVFTAVSEGGINVGMMSAGASRAAYHFTVKMDVLNSAMNAVHRVFFGD
jgi:aspartokinase